MVVLASSKMVIKLKVSPLKGNALTKTIREKKSWNMKKTKD